MITKEESRDYKLGIWNYQIHTAAAKSLQACPTLCSTIRQKPTRFPRPWDSPGKNTGVRCHFLLQCVKVKSESEVAQSCPTLSDPMDRSLPGSTIHGIFQARVLIYTTIYKKDKQGPIVEHRKLYSVSCDKLTENNLICIYIYTHTHTHIHKHLLNDFAIYLKLTILQSTILKK